MMKSSQHRLDYIKKWQKENPEKFKSYQRKYRLANKDKLYAAQKKRYPEIKDKINARKRERRRVDAEYRGKRYVYRQKWLSKDPEYVKKIFKGYRKNHYERYKDRILNNMHNQIINLRLETIYWYSDGQMCCLSCGEKHIEFLSIDHINNGGRKERQLHKGNFIKYLVTHKFPNGYQILCHNCNLIKESELKVRGNPSAPYHKYRDHVKRDMISLYSNGTMKCACCGLSDIRTLTFNHINGNGTQESRDRKEKNTSIYLYRLGYRRDDINVLCYNCNSSMGYYGYCPHKIS